MRVLLINSNTKRVPWPVPPIGLCSVATHAEAAGHSVSFLDLTFADDLPGEVARAIRKSEPQAIGISVRNIDNNTWRETAFYPERIKERVVDVCKQASPAKIVIGGAAVGIGAQELLKYLAVDYAIQGDGERAFVSLLEAFGGTRSLPSVKGLVFRDGATFVDNGYDRIDRLDDLLFTRPEHWIDLNKYRRLNGNSGVQTKRGCSLSCSYCAYPSIEGTRYRLRAPTRIADEVQEIIDAARPPQIEILDSTFNVPLNHALEICDEFIKRKFDTTFRAMSVSPVSAPPELFEKMRAARFVDLDINAESVSDVTLKALGKSYKANEVLEVARSLKRLRLPAMWFFLFGAPGETIGTIEENFDFIDRHISRSHLCVIAAGVRINSGTDMMRRALRDGLAKPGQNFLFPMFYESPEMPKSRLLELVEERVAKRPNCVFLREESFRPPWLIKAVKSVHDFLGLKRPLWQYEIGLARATCALRLRRRRPSQVRCSHGEEKGAIQ
jgi:radical SAM superfamily enzyme YgiQ (UPF0313 family)